MTSPTAPRPRAVWDIVLSIVFMVLAVLGGVIGLISQAFILAFTDDCPPATCHIDQGANSVLATWAVVAVVLLVSIVLTIVLLVRRRRAWWVALIGIVVVILGGITAFVLYVAAVGYGT